VLAATIRSPASGEGTLLPKLLIFFVTDKRTSHSDMQISRIRLSDETSRLHPRHVVPKPA